MTVKTLHLTNSWHATSGGIATFYRALMAEANRRNAPMRLVVPGESDRVEEVGACGRIYHVKAPPALLNSNYRMLYPSQFLAPKSKLQTILALERPDVVEICDKYTLNYFAGLLRMGMLREIDFRPLVVGLSCERMDDNFRTYLGQVPFFRAFCAWYMRWTYFALCDHHIANSSYTAEELQKASRGHAVSRGTWVRPMGIDLSRLSPARRSKDLRQHWLNHFGADESAVLLLYVGRLVPEKNLPLLFDVLNYLNRASTRNFYLLVAGDGIERQRWQQACSRNSSGRVSFLGHVADPEVLSDLYANADVFVHPNPREPFGIAPLEAMASGLPLVAPNTGGVVSYANRDNAWIEPAGVPSFAHAIEEVVGNDQLRMKKVERALIKAQEYAWENVAAGFLDLYNDLHQVTKLQREAIFPPDFVSTPLTGPQRYLFHGITQTVQRTFGGVSRLFSRPSPTIPASRADSAPG